MSGMNESPTITFSGLNDTSMTYHNGDVTLNNGTLSIYNDNSWQEITAVDTVEDLESKVQRLEKLVEKLIQQLAPELAV